MFPYFCFSSLGIAALQVQQEVLQAGRNMMLGVQTGLGQFFPFLVYGANDTNKCFLFSHQNFRHYIDRGQAFFVVTQWQTRQFSVQCFLPIWALPRMPYNMVYVQGMTGPGVSGSWLFAGICQEIQEDSGFGHICWFFLPPSQIFQTLAHPDGKMKIPRRNALLVGVNGPTNRHR